jgi:ATP-dependent 26S proteasome regulatory subunit
MSARNAVARLPLPQLSPVQSQAYALLRDAVDASTCTQIESAPGQGKTTLLRQLVRELGGALIEARQFFNPITPGTHVGVETTVLRHVEKAFATHDLVAIDDINTIAEATDGGSRGYSRYGSYKALAQMLSDLALAQGKRLVVAGTPVRDDIVHWEFDNALTIRIGQMGVEDYEALLTHELGAKAVIGIDVGDIFEHAPALSVYQLLQLARLARANDAKTSAAVRTILDTRILRANTRTEEVEDLSFSDLKGFEHIAEALTTHVLNPLRSYEKLRGLGLRPKRGVLLFGPPGTGKTSIGRALARQMQGKFFLIDGAFSPEPASTFYRRVQKVINDAKRAAPSVLFIDDADVLLQSGYAPGYGRMLLSMLDGLESATSGKIAVILTAMNPSHLPPALLRSGRVELWLETKAPADNARSEIVAAHVANLPKLFQSYDPIHLNSLTEGFNAADMRRLVADVKALYAIDAIAGASADNADVYFAKAAANVRRNKELLALAETGRFKFGAVEAASPAQS